ncbi:density-regulated protein homolog [Haliotis cracherodii]|uniref:density-regulated protein homolog n=1 Tax=Haliotis rufescens TaxID=6454 RepID=UPI001EB08D62|nr:density-regulated protein homolog [Haliotis rufescens]XP_046356012.1 density-regulated protein homolog [Haliotis rufescens]
MAAADVAESGSGDHKFLEYDGPRKGVKYPMRVLYCGECSMPVEYCEFYPNYEKCKEWLKSNIPEEFSRLMADKDEEEGKAGEEDGEKKKRQTRGGKGMMKAKKKTEPQGIKMWTATRGKKKKVTFVAGLASYEIDLKDACKFFATKFSCGSSVMGEDEIVIQGDVKDDLWDILPEKWKQIDEDDIDDKGDKK